MKLLPALAIALAFLTSPAQCATLSKSYSYFSIRGDTLDEIQADLNRHGPKLKSTGQRHPGATMMEFKTRLGYGERNGRCEVVHAKVQLKAKVVLPRWRSRRRSDGETRLIWDTLAADIRRHEESHIVIAKNHARELEQALNGMRPQKSCDAAKAKAKEMTQRMLARHDAAQAKFDRIEGINFERRIRRLLDYRVQRAEAGR